MRIQGTPHTHTHNMVIENLKFGKADKSGDDYQSNKHLSTPVPKQMDAVWWKGPGQSIRVDREVDRKEELGKKLYRGV